MRVNVKHIIPAGLAFLLPLLSAYSSKAPFSGVNSIEAWFFGVAIIYALWYGMWFIGQKQARMQAPLRWPMAFIIYVLIILLTAALTMAGVYWFGNNQEGGINWYAGIRIMVMALVLLLVQYALRAQANIAALQLEKENLETENLRAQLQGLRAQVDPHFLFNSLNTLRSMVRQGHANSEDFIIGLSDFYRQTLKHNENSTIALEQELAVLKSYLLIMQSRNEAAVTVKLAKIDAAFNNHRLPTLALQVVLENCFKHNSMTTKSPLHIEVQTLPQGYIEVANNIQPKLSSTPPSGFGLKQLQKRYDLLGIENGVVAQPNSTHFKVRLKLIQPL